MSLNPLSPAYRRVNFLVLVAILMVTVLVFVTLWASDIDEFAKGIVTLVLGRFLGYIDNVYNFEFGTTRKAKEQEQQVVNGITQHPKEPPQ